MYKDSHRILYKLRQTLFCQKGEQWIDVLTGLPVSTSSFQKTGFSELNVLNSKKYTHLLVRVPHFRSTPILYFVHYFYLAIVPNRIIFLVQIFNIWMSVCVCKCFVLNSLIYAGS